jgi:hypothetical protein
VQAGHYYPQQPQQAHNKQGIVEPDPAKRVGAHTNLCSVEHTFARKPAWRHIRITVLFALAICVLSAGCVAGFHRSEMRDLFDQLSTAQRNLSQPSANSAESCAAVGGILSTLYGEPGLADIQPAWTRLRDAANALKAACSQLALLGQPTTDSPTIQAARARWQQGQQREVAVACQYLRETAPTLGRDSPC